MATPRRRRPHRDRQPPHSQNPSLSWRPPGRRGVVRPRHDPDGPCHRRLVACPPRLDPSPPACRLSSPHRRPDADRPHRQPAPLAHHASPRVRGALLCPPLEWPGAEADAGHAPSQTRSLSPLQKGERMGVAACVRRGGAQKARRVLGGQKLQPLAAPVHGKRLRRLPASPPLMSQAEDAAD